MRLLIVMLSVLLMLAAPLTHAVELWTRDDLTALCQRLPTVTPSVLKRSLGTYQNLLRENEGLAVDQLRLLDYSELEPLLTNAARNRWGILEVFTQAALAEDCACALLMDQSTLTEVDRHFDLHAVWQLSAALADSPDHILPMTYMIVGRGRLVLGYPKAATVTLTDGDAISGNYDYVPYFSARIENSVQRRGLYDIRGYTAPHGAAGSFIGPYGVKIHDLTLSNGDILVRYTLGLDQERRTRNVAITLRSLVASR